MEEGAVGTRSVGSGSISKLLLSTLVKRQVPRHGSSTCFLALAGTDLEKLEGGDGSQLLSLRNWPPELSLETDLLLCPFPMALLPHSSRPSLARNCEAWTGRAVAQMALLAVSAESGSA
jgi:hypothetical protein